MAPIAIWMQPVAAPAAPAICGKGCMAACMALGAISPKARLPSTRSEMTRERGIQCASVMASSDIVETAARTRPVVSG